MKQTEFKQQFERLERLFNKGEPLADLVRDEYFQDVKWFSLFDLTQGIDELIKTHVPYTGHVFPSPSALLDALNDTMKQGSVATPDDLAGYCPKCDNQGWELHAGPPGHSFPGSATPCTCTVGQKAADRFKRTTRAFYPHGRKPEQRPHFGRGETKKEEKKVLNQQEQEEDQDVPF